MDISNESATLVYLDRKAVPYRLSGTDQAALDVCPFCDAAPGKLTVNVSGGEGDGLWICHHCNERGNLKRLREHFGEDEVNTVLMTMRQQKTAAPLPNIEAAHKRLMEDDAYKDVLEYLVCERHFSTEVLETYKIGAESAYGKKWVLIPYINGAGHCIYVKYRTVPPHSKEFRSSSGREAPLFNESVVVQGLEELFIVEGEADCLALLSAGVKNVVGVPGAGVKKAAWIERMDNANPQRIYLLYDRDRKGQEGAKEIAKRIGVKKVYNIVLPEFSTADGKPGKDVNEWLAAGHTAEELRPLCDAARPFNVEGVAPVQEVLADLISDIEGNGLKPSLDTPWPSLNNKLVGVEYGDVVGIMAQGKIGKTTMALNWLNYYASCGVNALLYCLEMPPKRLVRKWCCHITGDTEGELGTFSKESIVRAQEIAAAMPGELLFGFTQSKKADIIFDTIRQCVRRYGVKVVAFDNLQFLVRSVENSAQETANISKRFKELAMELGIVILLVIQPNRVREGQLIEASNAYGSSAIEKDVDAMIVLHRNRVLNLGNEAEFDGYLETDQTFEPQMLVRVGLTRYSSGGACTLWMDGASSTVREFSAEEKAAVLAVKKGKPTGKIVDEQIVEI